MLSSNAIPVRFRGRAGTIRVFRNNGSAWGRINLPGGDEFDVYTNRDYYEYDDASAAAAFMRAANRGQYEPAIGWRGC